MKVTRRNFIQATSVFAVTATLLGSVDNVFAQADRGESLFAIPVESTSDPLTYLTRAHFEPFVHTYMQVENDDLRVAWVQLISVDQQTFAKNQKSGFTGESFSLLFESTERAPLPSGIYTFRHDSLGTFSLFLGPVSMTRSRYEAVINRISR